MKTLSFNSLDVNFRKAFIRECKKGSAKFTVKGIKDDPDSLYPLFEVSNNHVSYYKTTPCLPPYESEWIVLTDKPIEAVIYIND